MPDAEADAVGECAVPVSGDGGGSEGVCGLSAEESGKTFAPGKMPKGVRI